jgi:predicted dehydrogenase
MSDGLNPISVGIVGCGEVSQIVHLPLLHELDEFRIVGVCDLSAATTAYVGDRYNVAFRTTDYEELLWSDQIEAVVVATYDHAPVARAALEAGKHLLVEKPLAFTLEEAAPLAELAERSGVAAIVGYMKLYDSAIEQAHSAVGSMSKIRAVHVHNFAGRFDRHALLYTQFRGADVAAEPLATAKAEAKERVMDSLGEAHAGYAELYTLLLMLGSHDLSVLRALRGAPERVAFARGRGDEQLFAVLEYADEVLCTFELGVGANYEGWDEWVAIYAEREQLRIEFPNPYVRYAPTLLRYREPHRESPAERVVAVSHESPFRREWLHFARCIRGADRPRTPLIDGVRDVELAREIVQAMPPRKSQGPG